MTSHTINIKSLSVNKAWKGKRFKTKAYKDYEQELYYILPNLSIPKNKLSLEIAWGFSNSSSDIDNPIKPFLDVLQHKYDFDDKMIYELILRKQLVTKANDFIKFEIKSL